MKRKMNRLSFSEIYQLPFKIDDDCPVYVWSSSGILTFNVCINDLESVRKLIDILNGDSDKKSHEPSFIQRWTYHNRRNTRIPYTRMGTPYRMRCIESSVYSSKGDTG